MKTIKSNLCLFVELVCVYVYACYSRNKTVLPIYVNTGKNFLGVSQVVMEYQANDVYLLCWLYAVTHVGYYGAFLLIDNTLGVKVC
jgi:hypothetical protein